MGILWLFVGIALGCGYIGLQWVQVKRVFPDRKKAQGSYGLLYFLRLILFALVTGVALSRGFVYGVEVFVSFWVTRSLLLILIGSGRIKLFARSGS